MPCPAKIIRVFPRKTNATPDDDLVRIGVVPTLFDEADEIHVSVTFTWDLPLAEKLAKAWAPVAPVRVGGPATGEKGGEFTPGMYVKPGYLIHSRGCPNSCWFCCERETELKLLTIHEGYNDISSNLLACPDDHIKNVFAAMQRGKKIYGHPIEFTGGLEAKRLEWWHVQELKKLHPKQLFFAYDTSDDWHWLYAAGWMLIAGGFTLASHALRAYVLCGYPKDTFAAAEMRMRETMQAGFMPMAMVYRDAEGNKPSGWAAWQRQWARPSIMAGKS